MFDKWRYRRRLLDEKKRRLYEIGMEHQFFKTYFSDTLKDDEHVLRKKLTDAKRDNKPYEEIIAIEEKVNRLKKIQGRLNAGSQVESELRCFISLIEKS